MDSFHRILWADNPHNCSGSAWDRPWWTLRANSCLVIPPPLRSWPLAGPWIRPARWVGDSESMCGRARWWRWWPHMAPSDRGGKNLSPRTVELEDTSAALEVTPHGRGATEAEQRRRGRSTKGIYGLGMEAFWQDPTERRYSEIFY